MSFKKSPIFSPKKFTLVSTGITILHFEADIAFASDYSPFGSGMSGRSFSGYRYGFNGQEKDDEIAGKGNSNTADFWQYDGRLGRRWNRDPKGQSSISHYCSFSNNPLYYVDAKGDTIVVNGSKKFIRKVEDGIELIRNTKKGNDLYLELQNDTKIYTIREYYKNITKVGIVPVDDKRDPKMHSWNIGDIGLNVNDKLYFDMGGNNWLSLAHEFSHAVDVKCGWSTNDLWKTPDFGHQLRVVGGFVKIGDSYFEDQTSTVQVGPIMIDELRAMNNENIIRVQAGFPIREYYSNIKSYKVYKYSEPFFEYVPIQRVAKDGIGLHPFYNVNYNELKNTNK